MKTEFWGNEPEDVDCPEWIPLLVSPNGIRVTYQEKYGSSVTEDCIGLWFSKKLKKYKLTWKSSKTKELPESNINSIEWSDL